MILKDQLNFVLTILFLTVIFSSVSHAAEVSASEDSQNNGLSTTAAILISVGLVVTGVLFVAICSFAWFRRQFRKVCPVEPPPDEDPPYAVPPDSPEFPRTNYGSVMTLDPANLPNDHRNSNIEFEPIPSIEALSRATTRYYVNENGDARLSFDSLQSVPIVVAPDDPHIYAHDWFANPTLQYPRSDLNFIQEVGIGWFGTVLESDAKDIEPYPPRSKVWVKYLREEASEREQMKFLDEARVYRDSNHKNILKLLGHCTEAMPYLLIFEHYPKGDLKAFLVEHSKDTSLIDSQGANLRSKMALDIAHGLDWMHNNNFVHPDLAARNCLVGNNGQIVVGDYGIATHAYKSEYYWSASVGIPIRWMAPESVECSSTVIRTIKTTKEANIWSFGVLLWELCELGKFPYSELTDDQVLSRVITDKNYSLKPPSITSLPYVSLRNKMAGITQSCFHPLPDNRPTIARILEILEVPL